MLSTTNKKLSALALRAQKRCEETSRINLTYERQVTFMEQRLEKLLVNMDPDKVAIFKKETRRQLHKIQTQADTEYEQTLSRQKPAGEGTNDSSELQLIAGELLKTQNVGTDMSDHL